MFKIRMWSKIRNVIVAKQIYAKFLSALEWFGLDRSKFEGGLPYGHDLCCVLDKDDNISAVMHLQYADLADNTKLARCVLLHGTPKAMRLLATHWEGLVMNKVENLVGIRFIIKPCSGPAANAILALGMAGATKLEMPSQTHHFQFGQMVA